MYTSQKKAISIAVKSYGKNVRFFKNNNKLIIICWGIDKFMTNVNDPTKENFSLRIYMEGNCMCYVNYDTMQELKNEVLEVIFSLRLCQI